MSIGIRISIDRQNIDVLLEIINKHVMTKYSQLQLQVPYAESAKVLSDLHKYDAECQNVEYTDDYVLIKVVIAKTHVNTVAKYIVF